MKLKLRHKEILTAYTFLVPSLGLLSVFLLYPLVNVFWMSFHKWAIFGPPKWKGIDNYVWAFNEPNFWKALEFTGYYTLTVTPMLFFLAFVTALICNANIDGTTFFRSMFFLPVVMATATASFIWLWLYNEFYGVLLMLIKWLGIITEENFNVWTTGDRALWAVNIMVTWKFAGVQMIILIAGMQSIRDDLYEASTLMGASRLQNIIYITTPLIKHSIALALVMSIAGSIMAYEQFYIMSRGGPSNETRPLLMYIIDLGFKYTKLGRAAAISTVMVFIIFIVTLVQLKLFKR